MGFLRLRAKPSLHLVIYKLVDFKAFFKTIVDK